VNSKVILFMPRYLIIIDLKIEAKCQAKKKRRKGGRENQLAGLIHEIIPVSTV
jgi:hypothetical protein